MNSAGVTDVQIVMSRTTPQCKTFGRVEASDVILTRHWTAWIWRRGFELTLRGTGTRPRPRPHHLAWTSTQREPHTEILLGPRPSVLFIWHWFMVRFIVTAYLTMLSTADQVSRQMDNQFNGTCKEQFAPWLCLRARLTLPAETGQKPAGLGAENWSSDWNKRQYKQSDQIFRFS